MALDLGRLLVFTIPARFHVADYPFLTPCCQTVSHEYSAAYLLPSCKAV
jgi:hypothetical protein